jgi:superfamily I DNA/RNA helicase
VIVPYLDWKQKRGELDWNDLATQLINSKIPTPYDVIVADEAQDFSANQVRAITNQLAADYCLTFVLDSAQRIYARGFTWQEVGITMRPEQIHHLKENFRNTIEIAQLAASLIADLPIDDDGTIPDFTSCARHGPIPLVLRGKFNSQLDAAIDYIKKEVKLADESVVFLHPLGWFGQIKRALNRSGLPFVEITRRSEWPQGSENIALSTFHSAKGLEFDHVMILGLNAEVTAHGEDDDDDRLMMLRKLIAMGIGRARLSVVIGYKPEEASKLITYLDPSTYKAIDL